MEVRWRVDWGGGRCLWVWWRCCWGREGAGRLITMRQMANYKTEMFIHVYVSLCRLMCLSTCLDLVKRCCLLYKDLVSFTHIFQPIRTLLSKHLSAQTLPELLQVGAKEGLIQRGLSLLFFFISSLSKYLIFSFSLIMMFVVLLQEPHSQILETISSAPVTHSRLVLEKKKPIPLKLLTPKIVEV